MCSRCFRSRFTFLARFGEMLCERCALKLNLCEICGSIGPNPETQRHYDEYCFK